MKLLETHACSDSCGHERWRVYKEVGTSLLVQQKEKLLSLQEFHTQTSSNNLVKDIQSNMVGFGEAKQSNENNSSYHIISYKYIYIYITCIYIYMI